MNFQSLINGPFGIGLALFMSRSIPPGVGHRLGNLIADIIARRKDQPMVRAVRANQWVATGEKLSAAELDEQVRAVFHHSAQGIYDLYHTINTSQTANHMVSLLPGFQKAIEYQRQTHQAIFFVSSHTGNFDMAFRGIIRSGVNALVLSYPEPPSGYRLQNEMRKKMGMEIAPISPSALRLATERLRAGENVITGIDRPIEDQKYQITFFGRKANLPVTHVRLALKTGASIVVISNKIQPNGHCVVDAWDPIQLQPNQDLVAETVQNAEMLVPYLEKGIRDAPHQWLMFYPVWPAALEEMP